MPKNIMRDFKMVEISGVDVPAQKGAKVMLMKRHHEDETEFLKRDSVAVLTSETDGHAHLVWLWPGNNGGVTSHQKAPGEEGAHDHAWVLDADGNIIIGMNDGHVHTVERDAVLQALMTMAAGRLVDEVNDMVVNIIGKRSFSSEQRKELAESGKALPDGSFPIVDEADLKNAIRAFGRAKDKAKVARHINARAKALGLTDMLPSEGSLADLLKNDAGSTKPAGQAGKVRQEEDPEMADKKTEKAGEPTVEELTAQLARANQVAALNDVEKAHFNGLDDAGKDAFLAKSADDRKAELDEIEKRAQDDDPVVYKTLDGIELRKSSDPALVAMAKSNDALRKRNDELIEKSANEAFEKRADAELAHLPGTTQERAALLKSVEAIEDEPTRTAALNALKAGSDAMANSFTAAGVANGQVAAGSPDAELDELAKAHQAANPGMTMEQAHAAVLDTPKGAELYAKSLN